MTTTTSRNNPPGPRGNFLFGSLAEIQHHPLELITKARSDYGDVVRFGKIPPLNQYWYQVTHPDVIDYVLRQNYQNFPKGRFFDAVRLLTGNGLLVTDGKEWVQQRKLVQPAFHQPRLLAQAHSISSAAQDLVKRLEVRASRGEPFDIVEEVRRVALQAVGSILFSVDISGESQGIGRALQVALDYVVRRQFHVLNLPLNIPTPRNRAFLEARSALDKVVDRIINSRIGHEYKGSDVLSLLLQARDAETGKPISHQQLRDELVTLIIAGHDTTALALSWTLYLLAKNPEAAEKLRAELASVLNGRTPEVEDLPRLPYNRMVIEEALRLYPPVWVIARRSRNDDEVGGYFIPANTTITMPQYAVHRHPDFWPDPERFDPERFLPERSSERPRYAYFPFGAGPRQCVGSYLAMMEAQLILASIVQHFKFNLVNEQAVTPEPSITLRPKHSILLSLTGLSVI